VLVVRLNKRCSYTCVRGISIGLSDSDIHWMSTNHWLETLIEHSIWNLIELEDSCVTESVTVCRTQLLELVGLEQLFENIRKSLCDWVLLRQCPPNILCTSITTRLDKRKNKRGAVIITNVIMWKFCFFRCYLVRLINSSERFI
jgi:hypothetical protein